MAKPTDPKQPKSPTPSPAATLPMFRDEVDSEAGLRRDGLDPDDPIVKLAKMTGTALTPVSPAAIARAAVRQPTPAPRVTQAGPVVRAAPERVEVVTQIGSVMRTETVLRSELEREAFKRPANVIGERKSEPALRPPAIVAERKSEPALRPPVVEPPPPSPLPSPSPPPAPAPPAPAPPVLEPRSWSGRVLVPDLVRRGPGAPAIPTAAPAPAREAAAPRALPKRSAGESLARLFYFIAGGLLVAALAVYGGRFWRDSQPPAEPPPAQPAAPIASAALAVAGGRIELSADRHGVTRLAGTQPRWGAPLPAAIDALELTGPLVIGHAADTIVALDLETGRTRFSWAPPPGERWAPQHPAAIDDCLIAVTLHDHKTAVRCLDVSTGQQRWAATLNGDHDCMQPPAGVHGAVIVPCAGWTAVIDDRTGAATPIAGGVGLVGDAPPTLLRAAAGRLTTQPWSDTKRRFTQTGSLGYGAASVPAASAVLHQGQLVLRAVDTSDELAVIAPREGAQLHVTAPAYRLADATPLTARCGGADSPRFQLLELTPRVGASFDPATAGDRALALLDAAAGNLAWTSRKASGLHGARAAAPPMCRAGHYFVPLDIPDRAGKPASVMWIVDAETGKTAAVVAFDPEVGAAMSDLSADQLDGDRLVGVGARGVFELAWRTPARGLHDARGELEAVLGALP